MIVRMEWQKTNPGVWKSPAGFKIMQLGRHRFACSSSVIAWTYETKTLADAQRFCRAMSMSAEYAKQAA